MAVSLGLVFGNQVRLNLQVTVGLGACATLGTEHEITKRCLANQPVFDDSGRLIAAGKEPDPSNG